METSDKLSSALSTEEVAELGSPPGDDVETPTTRLTDLRSQTTAEAHLPGIAASTESAAEDDTIPDPSPIRGS